MADSSVGSTPAVGLGGAASGPGPGPGPRRQIACVLCQQRKVKCDHGTPCATCVKARVPCIQQRAQVTRRRRRRFPERDLLDRVRHYEDLLTKNHIEYEPLHPPTDVQPPSDTASPNQTSPQSQDSEDEDAAVEEAQTQKPKRMFESMRQEVKNEGTDEEMRPNVFKSAWDHDISTDEHLLFAWGSSTVPTYTLHPQAIQIFQLWQTFLDNVNPLLKVVHAPSVQGQILEAVGNVLQIPPALEALMFGVYATAVSSLSEEECLSRYQTPKTNLLSAYQLGCQQALLNGSFLRSSSRDCLTALFLYLVSIRPNTTPESLSSILAVALRLAQRMGIHSESSLAKHSVLEAEMRRRLWWALLLFDSRVGEMADFQTTLLLPMWDCKVPLNVNDSDLRQDMSKPPTVQGLSTDAVFAVVRARLADFTRHTNFHLSYYGPSLRSTSEQGCGTKSTSGEVDAFEKTIETDYLSKCDPENPLHFMTIWTIRASIAKLRLVEHHSRFAGSSLHQAPAQREAALSYALRMLQCDTQLARSPLAQRFSWLSQMYFPFISYIQTTQYLQWGPMTRHAQIAWDSMSENYFANQGLFAGGSRFFPILASLVLQAWKALELAAVDKGLKFEMPQIVHMVTERLGGGDDANMDAPQVAPAATGGVQEDLLMPTASTDHDFFAALDMSTGFNGISAQNFSMINLDISDINGVPDHDGSSYST